MSDISDIRVFARVIELGGFSAASESLGITASAVSKVVSKLEDRLGVRLLHRTTRRISPTPEGETFYLRAKEILAALDDAEAEVSRGQTPQGRLRVNSVIPFALYQLAPVLPDFVARYPKIKVELTATDRIVDLLTEPSDVAIRTGHISDPSLVVRKITNVERGIYASPDYLARRGTPLSYEQLIDHDCIRVSSTPTGHRWPFKEGERMNVVDVTGYMNVDNSVVALELAIAGAGIVRLTDILVGHAAREGRLVPILTDCHIAEPVPLSAVYPSGRKRLPKVRVFIDFVVERFKHAPWRGPYKREDR